MLCFPEGMFSVPKLARSSINSATSYVRTVAVNSRDPDPRNAPRNCSQRPRPRPATLSAIAHSVFTSKSILIDQPALPRPCCPASPPSSLP